MCRSLLLNACTVGQARQVVTTQTVKYNLTRRICIAKLLARYNYSVNNSYKQLVSMPANSNKNYCIICLFSYRNVT